LHSAKQKNLEQLPQLLAKLPLRQTVK